MEPLFVKHPDDVLALAVRNTDDQLVVSIGYDGSVTYGPGFTADDAAKQFWAALGANYPFIATPPS